MLWFIILSRAALFSALWWILAGASPSSWWVGVPTTVLALIVSVALFPSKQFVWRNLVVFVPRFLLRSLMGGIDVAWRAFHPARPITPALFEFPLRLPPGLPQVFMANTVSLLPGTLSVTIEDNILTVHMLNSRGDIREELRKVEDDVSRLLASNAGQGH
ncbi:MAG: Na+/H+ antiporter subunit E [Halieaceae bacterium]|jgi:multicomponent Na+:H+ antiporter subunit E|nr:Na+/H+ antiporter subunit E [Halieaceae bacterium]